MHTIREITRLATMLAGLIAPRIRLGYTLASISCEHCRSSRNNPHCAPRHVIYYCYILILGDFETFVKLFFRVGMNLALFHTCKAGQKSTFFSQWEGAEKKSRWGVKLVWQCKLHSSYRFFFRETVFTSAISDFTCSFVPNNSYNNFVPNNHWEKYKLTILKLPLPEFSYRKFKTIHQVLSLNN